MHSEYLFHVWKNMVNLAQHKKDAAVDELESILKDNKEALILDLGAGTGIVGKYVSFFYTKILVYCDQESES